MNQHIQLTIMALTVAMEAGGEPYHGKLAVAYVIRNRAQQGPTSYTDVCLRQFQFSCWNTDSPTRMALDKISDKVYAECMTASLSATYLLEADPTDGATFYLNPQTVVQAAGKLPGWWDIDGSPDSEVRIGNHLFRKHRRDVLQRV